MNVISAPSDTRKGINQQQPRFNERKTILSGDTLRQNSFQELTDSRLQKNPFMIFIASQIVSACLSTY